MTQHTDEAVLAKAKQLHSFDYSFFATAWDDLPAVVQVGFMRLAGDALANEPEPGQRLYECYESAFAARHDNAVPRPWGGALPGTKVLWALTEAKYLEGRPAPELPAPQEPVMTADEAAALAEQRMLTELGCAVRVRRGHRKLADVEEEIGLGASTISRLERGQFCSHASLAKAKAWLNSPLPETRLHGVVQPACAQP